MSSEWGAAARLVRRTGFGATGAQVDAVLARGAAGYVADLLVLDPAADAGSVATPTPAMSPPPAPVPKADTSTRKARNRAIVAEQRTVTQWWLGRMSRATVPFVEKLTFVWHGHFATSAQKVRDPRAMLAQNEKLRALGRGDFGALARAVLLDAATVRWLDAQRNTVKGPNENLAREFMEIFTLGHDDGYTEQDVREGARALTGLRIDRSTGAVTVAARLHDSGSKTFLGVTGDLGPDEYCAAVLARPGGPSYVATRLWTQLVSTTPPAADVLARLTTAYGEKRDLRALLTAMLTDPAFAAAEGSLVIGPVEWLVGAARALGVPLTGATSAGAATAALQDLGQLPFFPPSVGGWPSGPAWASTAAVDLRFRYAERLVGAAQLPALPAAIGTARLEAVAHLLGVDGWSAPTLAVLKGVQTDPRRLLVVALNTPEYLVH